MADEEQNCSETYPEDRVCQVLVYVKYPSDLVNVTAC